MNDEFRAARNAGQSYSDQILHGPYARLAALAAVYELRVRLLADMREATRHATHAGRAEDVELALIKEYAPPAEEAERLRITRQLRNKVLHGAFREAKQKLADLGIVVPQGGVRVMKLDNSELPDDISSAAPITEPGGSDSIVGWLFECQASGFFVLAERAFNESLAILDRLREGA